MNLEPKLTVLKTGTHDLSIDERAKLACDSAKQFEKAGEYEVACEALAEFCPDRSAPPKLEGLDEARKADLLLRVGALAGWLGGAEQTSASQETAKNLITQSIEIFQALGQSEQVAEARGDLALCYWREGSYDDARVTLASALSGVPETDFNLKTVLLIRAATVEIAANRLSEAFRIFGESTSSVEKSTDHALKGSYHNLFAVLFRRLITEQNRDEYVDRALMEYTAAGFHFEQAGNTRYLASVENNLGFLFFTIGKYEEAHKHLDHARHLFFALSDVGMIAQVDETRARTLLAEGRFREAERFARLAVKTLEKGDEHALLAEALTTHGTVFARLGDHSSAKRLFQRAIEVAETTGDLEGAGQAKLSIIEELAGQTPAPQLVSIYQSAAELLKQSQDPSTSKRLIVCDQKVIEGLRTREFQAYEAKDLSWASFKREIGKAEQALVARALRDAEGSVTKAARLLGFKHHQSLISIVNTRHKDLLKTRSRIRKRRHHIFSESRKPKKAVEGS